MNGIQEVRIAKTAAPNANWRRRLERVGVPGTSCENRRASRLPARAAKKVARTTKPQSLCEESAAFVAEVLWDANPEHVFNVRREVYRHALEPDFRNATCPS
jgi:hypothetical protein